MKRLLSTAIALTLLFAVSGYAQLTAPAADNTPKVGDMAPEVALPNSGNAAIKSTRDYIGKKKVLLMFFPSAFTRGCTTEFTEAGQNHEKFVAANIEIIGISRDLQGALEAFKTSTGAKNLFVADPELTAINAYGALNQRRVANRYYFLIDETGKIAWKNVTGGLIPTEKLLADLAAVRSAN
jgi:peroxiredoxin Q/BCP